MASRTHSPILAGLVAWAIDAIFGLADREFLFALFFGLGFLGSIVKANV